jgi:hypothetical protein
MNYLFFTIASIFAIADWVAVAKVWKPLDYFAKPATIIALIIWVSMNGGLHDAFNLCGKLARVWHGEDASLLDLYVRQRHPVAQQEIIAQAHQNRSRMQ